MFSLVQFDNGELSVLSSKRIKITDGSNCIVRYIGGAKYSANVLDSSDTESFLIDAKEKISNDTMKLLKTNTLDDYSNQAAGRKASVDNLLRVPASRKTANNGLKIKKSNDTTKKKSSRNACKLIATGASKKYSDQQTDQKKSTKNSLEVPASRKTVNDDLEIKRSNDIAEKKLSCDAFKLTATRTLNKGSNQQPDQKKCVKNLLRVQALPKSSESDVKDKKLNVNSLKSTTIRKKSEIIFPSDQNLIKVNKKMKTVNLSKIAVLGKIDNNILTKQNLNHFPVKLISSKKKSAVSRSTDQNTNQTDQVMNTTDVLKAAVSKMVLQDSKTGTADNSTLLPSSQLGSSTQDTKRYCVNSSTPLNSSSTCSDNLGLSSILEDSKMINNDKSDFSKEHHDMKINNFVPETPTNSLSNTSVRLDASNLTDKNNMNSTNESPPPSGYSEELNKLGPNWPYDSSENVESNVVNSYNSNIDKSTEGIEHSSNHNSENINTNDTYSVTNVPDNLITNLTENDNEESITDASNDKGESMTKAQDSSYNPLNTTNESPLQTPIMKKINLKKSPPLLKSSLDIRKLNVPYASYTANANDLNPNGPQAAHREHKTKKHFCPYCKTLQSKFARHLMLKHKTEKDVRSFLFLPKHHFQRLKIIDMIRRKGDFLHNTDKDLNSGILILPRRRQENSTNTSEDYTCCTMCKGFFPNQTIRFHAKNCQTGRNKLARDILVSGRRVTGFIHEIANDMLRNEIFPILRDDDVSRSIRYDELIIKFGNKLTEKYALKHQHDGMRAQLRLLGRLKLEIMSNDNKITEFQDIFRPQNYDVVIKSLRNVANWDTASMTFKTPAVAKNLVTLVIKCCKKYRAECVKIQDEERKKLAEDFLLLWLEEVPLLINKKAEDDRNEQRLLKKVILPSKEDIKLLYDYLNKESLTCLEILKDGFNLHAWILLTQCTLISIQIFNRRRAGEIERLPITNYQNKEGLKGHVDNEMYNNLSDASKKFANQFVRLTVRGKRGRFVPVLLNPLAVKCLDQILAFRKQAGVQDDNEFIFSVPGLNSSAKKYIRACPLMRRFANDCGAEMPSALRGTNLRKHVATYTSLLNVEDCQINKLANFMGHAKEIHKSYYQIPVPVTEITEVSKMLLAALGNDDDNTYDPNDVSEDENSDSSDDDDDADENISRTDAPSLTDNQTSDDNNSSSGESKVNKSKRFKPSKILRRRWTNEENKILEKKFGKLCKMVTLPSVKQCVAIIKENDVLKSRTAAQIRSHIQNLKQRSH